MDVKAEEKSKGSIEELRALLRDFDTAMLVTVTPKGELRARPMALQHQPLPDCDLWFAGADDAPKSDELSRERRVHVSCMRSGDHATLSIYATARIEDGHQEVQRLWRDDWRIWFPDEPADGAIALLKVTVHRAEVWAHEGGRVRVIYEQPPAPDDVIVTASDR